MASTTTCKSGQRNARWPGRAHARAQTLRRHVSLAALVRVHHCEHLYNTHRSRLWYWQALRLLRQRLRRRLRHERSHLGKQPEEDREESADAALLEGEAPLDVPLAAGAFQSR